MKFIISGKNITVTDGLRTAVDVYKRQDEYYADGTYDTLWTKWIDASGEGEEAAAAEDAETAE